MLSTQAERLYRNFDDTSYSPAGLTKAFSAVLQLGRIADEEHGKYGTFFRPADISYGMACVDLAGKPERIWGMKSPQNRIQEALLDTGMLLANLYTDACMMRDVFARRTEHSGEGEAEWQGEDWGLIREATLGKQGSAANSLDPESQSRRPASPESGSVNTKPGGSERVEESLESNPWLADQAFDDNFAQVPQDPFLRHLRATKRLGEISREGEALLAMVQNMDTQLTSMEEKEQEVEKRQATQSPGANELQEVEARRAALQEQLVKMQAEFDKAAELLRVRIEEERAQAAEGFMLAVKALRGEFAQDKVISDTKSDSEPSVGEYDGSEHSDEAEMGSREEQEDEEVDEGENGQGDTRTNDTDGYAAECEEATGVAEAGVSEASSASTDAGAEATEESDDNEDVEESAPAFAVSAAG